MSNADGLRTHARTSIEWAAASDDIHRRLDDDEDTIPTDLYLDEAVTDAERRDNRSELDGAIWAISLLTRVDGAVVLDSDLAVRGFGVEITSSDEPGP